MEDDNEDNRKNKEDLHIAGRHTALDIFRFAVFFGENFLTTFYLLVHHDNNMTVKFSFCKLIMKVNKYIHTYHPPGTFSPLLNIIGS